MATEQVGNSAGSLEAIGRVFGVQAVDDGFEPGGNLRLDVAQWPRVFAADALEYGHRRTGPKWRLSRAEDIQHAAQAEQVAALVDVLALGLFGRHIGWCARDESCLRPADVVDRLRQAEVRDFHPLDAVFQKDVGRLDIPMNQALRVSRRQSLGSLQADAQDLVQRQRPDTVDLLLERAPMDKLHHEEGHGFVILDGMNGDHVVVDDRRGGPGLQHEPPTGLGAGRKRRRQRLDGDHPVQLLVERPHHDSHTPAADDLQYFVMPETAQGVCPPGWRQKVENDRLSDSIDRCVELG